MIRAVLSLACLLALAVPVAGAAVGADSSARQRGAPGELSPQDRPDIVGPGKITRAGDLWVKTTNIGVIGNPYPELSSDPAAQWPGPSGVEYLYFASLWVGARIPGEVEPTRMRRVSQGKEWRPPTLDPADRIYEAHGGDPGSRHLFDDDGDGRVDEDRLDGRDNDGDGRIDEDYGAVSEQMFSCVMRDDTEQAQLEADAEAHVPIGLEVHLTTCSFSTPGLRDFVGLEYEIVNVSGHLLDSVFVGFHVDQDVGPVARSRYFADDLVEPRVPQGPDLDVHLAFDDPQNPNAPYREIVAADDPKYQPISTAQGIVSRCPEDTIEVNGFTMVDNDGDEGATPGASSFLLLDHTIDRLGWRAPRRVGFRMFSYHRPGATYAQGGLPTSDMERFEALSSTRGVDPQSGRITAAPAERPDDYSALCSVGPFLSVQPMDTVRVVVALAVADVDYRYDANDYRSRYRRVIENAVAAQVHYNGRYEIHPGYAVSDRMGRESALRSRPGETFEYQDCRDAAANPPAWRVVSDDHFTWFDLDCDYCTGVQGHLVRHWLRTGPPPPAKLALVPGDSRVTLRWDNRSEYTPDRLDDTFDFAGYRVWKAAGWTRPAGTVGPGEQSWELLATYYRYDAYAPLIERVVDPQTGDTAIVRTADVLVNRTWRPGSPFPRLLLPQDVPCLRDPDSLGICDSARAGKWVFTARGTDSLIANYGMAKYPVGRYELVDPLVHNGFLYLYSVTAFDSSGRGSTLSSWEGRRSAIEGEAVVPQGAWSAADNGGRPYVVPNPYRGRTTWDLTPSPADPTGTHVDFFNLPHGWTRLRIYTLSGDLVQEILPGDALPNGRPQREGNGDDEASWNLVSRNGQSVASGIYLFTVEAPGASVPPGKFVIVR